MNTIHLANVRQALEEMCPDFGRRFSCKLVPNSPMYLQYLDYLDPLAVQRMLQKHFPEEEARLKSLESVRFSDEQVRQILFFNICRREGINGGAGLLFDYGERAPIDYAVRLVDEYVSVRNSVRDFLGESTSSPTDFTGKFASVSFVSVKRPEDFAPVKRFVDAFCNSGYVLNELLSWDSGQPTFRYEGGQFLNAVTFKRRKVPRHF